MMTIYEYLEKYKDIDIDEEPWNDMDNLLLSILVYIPIDSFMGTKSFDEMCNMIVTSNIPNKSEYMAPKIKGIIEIIKNYKRYKDLKFKNFENIVNNDTQFGAMVCKIRNNKIIVFKGTDRSIIGWMENFRCMYDYPTITQKFAIKYLNNNIGLFDKNITVTGHSKGGNMSMASVMELNTFKFNKIKKIVNFDGPGFRKKEYDSIKYKKMNKKLINIIPSNSYVGVLMFNDEYNVIKTSVHGLSVHYPLFWYFNDKKFVKDKLSKISNEIHVRSTKELSKIDEETVREYFETAFKTFDNKKTEFIKFNIIDIIKLLKSIHGLDKNVSEYVNSILKSMIKLSKNKEDD